MLKNVSIIIIFIIPFQLYAQESTDIQPSDITKIIITTDDLLSYSGQQIILRDGAQVQIIPRKQETILPIESIYLITITYLDSTGNDSSSLGTDVLTGTVIGAGIGALLGLFAGDTGSGDVVGYSRAQNVVLMGISGGVMGCVCGLTYGLLKSDTGYTIDPIDISDYSIIHKQKIISMLIDNSNG